MFCYTAYGLGISSSLALPELVAAEEASDVVVRPGRVDPRPPVVEDRGCALWAEPGEARFFYEGVGAFLIRAGREVVFDGAPEVDDRLLRLAIMGPAIAMLLHQRGRLVLHASTVALNGGAVALLGRSGQGKSTLAAALYQRDHPLVADDVTAVDLGGSSSAVQPGYPRLKLWPEVASALGEEVESLPRIRPWLDKRNRRADRGFPRGPLPLRHIYVLAEGQQREKESLRPQRAVIELVQNSYPAVANLLRASETAASHFRQCVELSQEVPVSRLKSPRCLSGLPELAKLVEEDLV
jgi:hypothetical protein